MFPWKSVESDTTFPIYQISQTRHGVKRLHWSPDGTSLLLEVATGIEGEFTGVFGQRTHVILDHQTHAAWSPQTLQGMCDLPLDWSPDGQHLAFLHWKPERYDEIRVAERDGSNTTALPLPAGSENAYTGVYWLHYSPLGDKIAFLAARIENNTTLFDLWTYEFKSGALAQIIEDAGHGDFAWSPDGEYLAHLGSSEATEAFPIGPARLWIVSADGSRIVYADLTDLPGSEGCLAPPTWLLNGQKVLATVLLQKGVWIMDKNGAVLPFLVDMDSISHYPTFKMAAPLMGSPAGGAVASPRGDYVVLSPGDGKQYLLDVSAGITETLPGENSFSHINWSPRQPVFAYWSSFAGLEQYDARDGSIKQLDAAGFWPAWSPDGTAIAFVASPGEISEAFILYP